MQIVPKIHSCRVYKTQDGMISLAVIDENQFKKLCIQVLKREDFIERYATNKIRVESPLFEKELSALLAEKTSAHWIALCATHRIACSPVNSMRDVIQSSFAPSFFSRTRNNTTIISNPYVSSLFKEPQLTDAPQINEHQAIVGTIFKYIKDMQFNDIGTLWHHIKNDPPIAPKNVKTIKLSEAPEWLISRSQSQSNRVEQPKQPVLQASTTRHAKL